MAAIAYDIRTSLRQHEYGREFWIVTGCMALLVVYSLLETLGIQTKHSLYENVIATDWSIRIGLVETAVRSCIPPLNPFYDLAGHVPTMRYYFWYELCAQVVRLTHIPARAALVASTVWSAFGLISVLFLCVKHLSAQNSIAPITKSNGATQQASSVPLRRICLAALGLTAVSSLLLIPALLQLVLYPRYPELNLEMRTANEVVAAALPADAVVQANPEGLYQPIFTDYMERQTAAGDEGCESAFGGSFEQCRDLIVAPLHDIYGGSTGIPLQDGELPKSRQTQPK